MATLWVTEYFDLARDGNNWIMPVPPEPAITTQTVTVGAEADSAAFNARTRYVRLYTDTACHVLFGSAPTATTGKTPLGANQEYWCGVQPGDKVSVIVAA